jgi:GT2 family glycosyltransferase
MDLSICIPSWNTRELLRGCLESLAWCRGLRWEVLVADNASQDGSPEMVAAHFPAVKLLRNRRNLGFAAACNQMIRAARGRHVLLLNSDTRFESDALGPMVRFLDHHPEAAAVGPLVRRPDGALQRSWGPLPSLGDELRRCFTLDRKLRLPASVNGDGALPACEVDNLMAACLLLRRRALEQVGLLDEGFFHYGEDVDLCWRLRRRGWKLHLLPTLTIIHHGGASSERIRREVWVHYFRAKCRLFRRHRGPGALVALKVLLAAECTSKALLNGCGHTPRARDRVAAYHSVLKGLVRF